MKVLTNLLWASLLILLATACAKDKLDRKEIVYTDDEYALLSQYLNLPESPLDYDIRFPDYYPTRVGTHPKNLAALGRVLFYDKALSADGKVSCGSCHQQSHAFSDAKVLSDGVNGQNAGRNAIALGSVFSFSEYYGHVWMGRIPFLWDNRAGSADEQARMALTNPQEMGMSMHGVVNKVAQQPYYAPLFRASFGTSEVSDNRVLQAISAFVNSMASVNSRFDDAFSDEFKRAGGTSGSSLSYVSRNFRKFNELENRGKALYLASCASCHGSEVGAPGSTAANNGLYMDYADKGIGALTNNPGDMGRFKVPSLRNVALTAPYMHDGSMATLDEVLEHYSNGIRPHTNLSQELKSGGTPRRFNFSDEDKAALMAFLNTLTDQEYLVAERYSDPFLQ